MKRLGFAASALLCVLSVPGQTPTPTPAPVLPVLIGTKVVEVHSGTVLGELPAAFEGRWAWFGPQLFGAEGATVDIAREQVFTTTATGGVLRNLAGKEVWAATVPIGGRGNSLWGQPRLAGERVLVPQALHGLAGLDRRDGSVVWRNADCGNELFTVDGDLVLCVRRTEAGARLSALAVQNGARAFAMELPRQPYFVRPTADGIALSLPEGLVVVDRSGPELFRVPGPVVDATSGREFWFVLTAEALTAFDRRGERAWRQELPASTFDRRCLGVLPDGAPVLCSFSPMADSGCVVARRDPHDGGEVWERTIAGLGIGHSKYWHEANALPVGDELVVTSHAAGGSFVVLLDPQTGAVVVRRDQKRG